jgi:hypothetical protein
LACPPAATPENIAAFIDTYLSAERFAEYLADPDRVVLAAYDDGYCMLIRGIPDDDPDVQRAVTTARASSCRRCTSCPTTTAPVSPRH